MNRRINCSEVASGGIRALLDGIEAYVRNCGLEPGLFELLKTRSSLRNRSRPWRTSPYYSVRERAALALAESVTFVSDGSDPSALFEEARRYFSEKELADLTLALVAIDGRNRLSVAFRTMSGRHQPAAPAPVGDNHRR